MKVFSVCGYSGSGKTTTVELIISELRKRGRRVGSVKEIHYEPFAIDPSPTSNTHRHRQAGAELVTARANNETDLLFPGKLPMKKILSFYEGYDYVALEGVEDCAAPVILTAHGADGLDDKWSDNVFCVSGRFSDTADEYRGVRAISAIKDIQALTDLIEDRACDLPMGFFDSDVGDDPF